MKQMKLTLYSLIISLLALAMGFFLYSKTLSPVSWPDLLMIILLLLILSNFTMIQSGTGSRISLNLPVILTALFYWGPFWGAIMASVGTIQLDQLKAGFQKRVFIINRSMIYLSAGTAGYLLFLSGNEMFSLHLFSKFILIIFLAALSYYIINHVFIGIAFSLFYPDRKNEFLLYFVDMAKNIFYSTFFGFLFILAFFYLSTAGIILPFFVIFFFKNLIYANTIQNNSFFQVIEGFARVIDAKDEDTRGHSDRVAQYTKDLAESIKLSPYKVPKLVQIAKLHDVGKIFIPDQILLKPGPLTQKEFEIIKEHPRRGMEMLSEIDILNDYLNVILCHHEYYDGTGYPKGLKGDTIPLGARILALADAFDVMTSNRIYRKALGKSRVFQELTLCAGKQFDPILAKVMINLIEEGRYDHLFKEEEGEGEEMIILKEALQDTQ